MVLLQVAKLEQELDDAYDDLEPILQNTECKDDNVSRPCSQSLSMPKIANCLIRVYSLVILASMLALPLLLECSLHLFFDEVQHEMIFTSKLNCN